MALISLSISLILFCVACGAVGSFFVYIPRPIDTTVKIQRDFHRHLYDTSNLIKGLLTKEYLTDEEILRNQGTIPEFADYSKDGQKGFRKAQRRKK